MTVSNTPAVKSSTFLEAVKHRRTVYGVTDEVSVSDDRIVEIVNEVIQSAPSSWNMQSTRILVTLKKEHEKLWDAITDGAKAGVLETQGEEAWTRNEERFKSFRKAYGTITVFEDHAPIEKLHSKFSHFPIGVFEGFAEHSSAMHQIILWTAIELEGLGASLQHSHMMPGAEEAIRSAFDLPSSWAPKGEIVFGGLPGDMPAAPEKEPLSTTVKVFK